MKKEITRSWNCFDDKPDNKALFIYKPRCQTNWLVRCEARQLATDAPGRPEDFYDTARTVAGCRVKDYGGENFRRGFR
jgi:hypothetical protein